MTGSDERFAGRWSRLKQEARTPPTDDAPRTANLPAAEEPDPPAEETPTIAAEDLPDIESLDKDSDYTPFMQEGVPEELKKLALRALWRSDPVLANLDGLNDYDEDFKLALDVGAEFMRKMREAGEKVHGEQPEGEIDADGVEDEPTEESLVENDDEFSDTGNEGAADDSEVG